jgi:ABC-type nitrate/sulfonate/bicarbonate transport system substrate-binding protein
MANPLPTLPRLMLAALVFIPAALAAALAVSSCSPAGDSGDNRITIGMEATAVNSLIYISQEEGYFEEMDLEVTVRDDYTSGSLAAERMVQGEVDMATTAELAIVRQAFARESVLTLASIDRFLHMKLLVRKDRGIQGAADLTGKQVGVPVKTAADFVLGRFLDLNGVDKARLTVVDVQAPQAVDSLVNGDVDAVVAWQPNVLAIQDALGDRVSVWDVQSGQPLYCALVAASGWVREHPDLVERFLKALARAEDYMIRNPGQAGDLIQARLGYDDRYINTIWPEHQFTLRLDQSLILAMEDEARWMISNNLTTERTVPNFLDYIYTDGLKSVTPDAVRIAGK